MTKILLKSLLLLLLVVCLIGLVIYHPLQKYETYEKAKIIEKYYSSKPGEKLIGSRTKKKISLHTNSHTESCAMEFDNGKILEMNCNTFLDYSIGEKVKIKYKDGKLIDISRK